MVDDWYKTFHTILVEFQGEQARQSFGEFDLDESYFGKPRKKLHAQDKRKHGRCAENKVPTKQHSNRKGIHNLKECEFRYNEKHDMLKY
jgi:hypothetical protein